MSGQGIFEIREYIDSDGNIEKHDVRDISKELEYFSKLCANDENSLEENVNEDDQFVRELALLSEGIDIHADDPDFLDNYIEQDLVPALSASVGTQPRSNVQDVKPKTPAKSAASGWKKGFLGKSSVVRETVDQPIRASASASAPVGQHNPVSSPMKGTTYLESVGVEGQETVTHLGGTLEGAESVGTFSAPGAVQSTIPQAFTGSVLERIPAPPQPVAARVPGQSAVLLGPKARSHTGSLAK